MRKVYVLVALFVLALIGAAIFCFSFGQRPLTDYLGKLRAQGEVLTSAELAATLSLNPGDSSSVLTNAAARLGPFRGELTRAAGFRGVLTNPAAASWRGFEPPLIQRVTNQPVALTWQECAQQVTARAAVLEGLRQALRKVAPHATLRTNWWVQATPIREVRCCADWLYLAAVVDLHDGHPAESFTNVQTLANLANLHREEYQFASQLLRAITGQLGLTATWDLLGSDQVTEARWASLQSTWESVDLLAGLERATVGDRCFLLEGVPRALPQPAKGNMPLLWPLYRRTLLNNDLLFGLRQTQGAVECARALRQNQPWPEVQGKLRELAAELKAKAKGPKRYVYPFTPLLVPDFSVSFSHLVDVERSRRLTVTAIALKRYHLAHGEWPQTLDVLVPEFLSALPRDCMTGKAFGYERTVDGNMALHGAAEPSAEVKR